MQREEEQVCRETARRLLPPDQLAAFVRGRGELQTITASDLAQEWDTTETVAAQAPHLLLVEHPPMRSAAWGADVL